MSSDSNSNSQDNKNGAVKETRQQDTNLSVVAESTQEVTGAVKKICFSYKQRGYCRFGEKCKYLHKPRDQKAPEQGETLLSPSELKQATDQKSSTGEDGPTVTTESGQQKLEVQERRVLCKFFARHGRCSFGSICRFEHVRTYFPKRYQHRQNNDQVKQERNENVAENGAAEGAKTKASQVRRAPPSQKIRSEDKKERPICRHFKRGECMRGEECRFWHPQDPMAIGVQEREAEIDGSFVSHNKEPEPEISKPRHMRPPVHKAYVPLTTYIVENLNEDAAAKLRSTETEQLTKRYPRAEESIIDDGETSVYKFTFIPSDPDWPYDVKMIPLEVYFDKTYPVAPLRLKLQEADELPETLARHIYQEASQWVKDRHAKLLEAGKVELAFRPFLRWLDKAAEDLFTDGLKKYKMELVAQAAGIEFVPASRIQNFQSSDSDQEGEENDDAERSEDEEDEDSEDYEDAQEDVDDDKDSEDEKDEAGRSGGGFEPSRHGTEVKLMGLALRENAATLLATHFLLQISCGRCKHQMEVKSPGDRLNTLSCGRCNESIMVRLRTGLMHAHSAIIGYLDLEGCSAIDMILGECDFKIGCLACSKEMKMMGLPPGKPHDTWCRSCHAKLTVVAESVRFQFLQPTTVSESEKAVQIETKKVGRIRDPAIQPGQPLPKNGTCKHYQKSFRWLRFPCCGKAYPCDVCHALAEMDHDMKYANRMICGYCCKEQPYSIDKACISCDANMTKRRTSHWEGGKGCRDKIKMSRDDPKKFKNTNKTTSRKSQAKLDSGKKTTKVRHA